MGRMGFYALHNCKNIELVPSYTVTSELNAVNNVILFKFVGGNVLTSQNWEFDSLIRYTNNKYLKFK